MDKNISIQETFEERFQHCWGCGTKNEHGLGLKSYPSEDGREVIASIKPDTIYTGGIPNNLFGGTIATLFDCHGTASAAYFKHVDKGLRLEKDSKLEKFITGRLEVDYIKPTPIGEDLELRSTLDYMGERKVIVDMVLIASGKLRAKAKIVAVSTRGKF